MVGERGADTRTSSFVFDRASLDASRAGGESAGDVRFRESPARQAQLVPMLRDAWRAQRRAIVAFPAMIDGRAEIRAGAAAVQRPEPRAGDAASSGSWSTPSTCSTKYFPALIQRRLATVQQPIGFPPLELYLLDGDGRAVTATGQQPPVRRSSTSARFPLVFFDRELLEYAAPYEQRRETWRVRTGYGAQTIPEIVSASTRPQMALMIVLALVMAGGVFFVASAAAREVRVAELKSNFVASVSHDLKTPLALIQLFAETLELGRVRNAERAQEYYRIINTEARKLTRLIENILDFSQMEAGPAPLSHGAGRYRRRSTTQVLSEMDSQFDQTQFTVQTHVEPDLPRVDGRRGRRRAGHREPAGQRHEVLGRVARHRRARRPREQPRVRQRRTITASASRAASRSGSSASSIASTAASAAGPQGCGLGLAIVDHTMRGHGGFVRVDSEPDRGSTFTLHFPIAAGATAEEDRHEAHSGDRGRTADVARSA